jgi:hypothetical protein
LNVPPTLAAVAQKKPARTYANALVQPLGSFYVRLVDQGVAEGTFRRVNPDASVPDDLATGSVAAASSCNDGAYGGRDKLGHDGGKGGVMLDPGNSHCT